MNSISSIMVDINEKKSSLPRTPFASERITRETAFFSLYTGTILLLVVILFNVPQAPAIVPAGVTIKEVVTHSTQFDVKKEGGVEALALFLSSHDRHARCYISGPGSLRSLMKKAFEYTNKVESLISLSVSSTEPLAKFFAIPFPKNQQPKEEEVLCQIED